VNLVPMHAGSPGSLSPADCRHAADGFNLHAAETG
jgi:hypothetical protein